MQKQLRVMTENPLNAETQPVYLRSWITPNAKFFSRNQSQMMTEAIPVEQWRLTIGGEVRKEIVLNYEQILRMPKVTVANTMECSGNGRSLLRKKAHGNPWTIGGVGNAVWGGVWLGEILKEADPTERALHVGFEGLDDPAGKATIKFIRSIPLQKAMESTLLAYEMNGDILPPEHGYPLRGLPLGWTGANSVKWLTRITLMDRPFEGHFMDKVYRIYREGEKSTDGVPVTSIPLKAIITQPLEGEEVTPGTVTLLGFAYGGDAEVAGVEISVDGGRSWAQAELMGPRERYAWHQWRYLWSPHAAGSCKIMARAVDAKGEKQPMSADWNVLGYGNNGVEEHAVNVQVTE